jgi:tetratricopeptide (TPR) repeat protein
MQGAQRICLNMIVRNEEAVIERCLASAEPYISSWVIVDTGSTDQTQARIRECLRHHPGELHERPWIDFGTNRTEALQLAQPYGDYTLVIDADEILKPEPGFSMPELSLDAYQLQTRFHDIVYYRTQLVRSTLPWRYQGVLHEYLDLAHPFTQGRLEGLVNFPQTDGARSRNPHKYAADAEVLKAALAKEPGNARYAYYLAQSYRDAQLYPQAIEAYRRRISIGGWPEETWSAMFELARLIERTEQDPKEVICAYLAAFEFRPQRAESLCALARYLRLQKRYELAYLFARRASKTERPNDILFVDASVYDWRAVDELSIACYYLGKHREAIELTDSLLKGSLLPAGERDRVRRNQEFSQNAITSC